MKKPIRIMLSLLIMTVAFFAMAAVSHAVTSVTATVMNTGNESYAYCDNSLVGKTPVIVPIVVGRAGTVELAIGTNDTTGKSIYAELYSDSTCSGSVISGTYMSVSGSEADDAYATVAAGTYYLKVYTYSADVNCTCRVVAGVWPSGEKVITSGQTLAYYNESSHIKDFKFTATVNGKITVYSNSKYGFYCQILNASKGALSDEIWCSDGTNCHNYCVFAVEKGKTYFVRIKANDSTTKILSAKLVQEAVKEKSGKSKKKAVTLKAKKKAKGTIAPGSKKADWYKIKVTKKKKLTVSFELYGDDYIAVTLYTSKGKKVSTNYLYGYNKWDIKYTYGTTYEKVNKGTYYLKIERKTKLDSAVYSVKWK